MDSGREKSTVQSRGHHFVSICPARAQAPRPKKRPPLIRENNKTRRVAILNRIAVLPSMRMDQTRERPTKMVMDRVDAYLETHRTAFEEQLKALDQDP